MTILTEADQLDILHPYQLCAVAEVGMSARYQSESTLVPPCIHRNSRLRLYCLSCRSRLCAD